MPQANKSHSIIASPAIADSAAPVGYWRKPAPAFLDPATIQTRFYGLILSGDCMEPLFKDGDKIIVDRESRPQVGDIGVFYHRPEHVPAGALPTSMKRLVTAIPDYVKFPWHEHPRSEVHAVVIVEQLNPERRWVVKCEHLLAVHRCIGRAADPVVQEHLAAAGWLI